MNTITTASPVSTSAVAGGTAAASTEGGDTPPFADTLADFLDDSSAQGEDLAAATVGSAGASSSSVDLVGVLTDVAALLGAQSPLVASSLPGVPSFGVGETPAGVAGAAGVALGVQSPLVASPVPPAPSLSAAGVAALDSAPVSVVQAGQAAAVEGAVVASGQAGTPASVHGGLVAGGGRKGAEVPQTAPVAVAQTSDVPASLSPAGLVGHPGVPGAPVPLDEVRSALSDPLDGMKVFTQSEGTDSPIPAREAVVPVTFVSPTNASDPGAPVGTVTAPATTATTVPVVAAPPADAPRPVVVASQIATQVAVLRGAANGSYTMTVQITPDDLGPVSVQITLDEGTLGMTLRAALEVGRDTLSQAAPELRRYLEQAGLSCNRVEVDLSNDQSSWFTQPDADTNPEAHHGPSDRREQAGTPSGDTSDNPRAATLTPTTSSGVDLRM